MYTKLLLLALSTAAFSSCSTAYKSGQTPDDVYYSPTRVVEETVRHDHEETTPSKTNYEEREIKMATYDRRWRDLNRDYDYDYAYNPYRYGYSYGYYYNPYYYPCPVYIKGVTISNPKNTTPRMTSLGSYTNTVTTVSGSDKYGTPTRVNTVRAYSNSNSISSPGNRTSNVIRRIITPQDNTSNSRSTNDNSRTYTPSNSSSSSSSSSSSGSSSGSVSRPTRGN